MTLLQFCGPQDIEAFGRVCEAVNDMVTDWTGGSHEFRIVAKGDRILFTDRFNDDEGVKK